MASPSTSRQTNRAFTPLERARGFTLVEVIVVLAIFAVLLGLGVFVGIDAYKATLARSERDVITGLLARARSSAMANISDTPWGLYYDGSSYILFRGTTYTKGASTNEVTPASSGVTITGFFQNSPVVFSQLAGTATPATITIPATITVVQLGHTTTITVNYEGAIQ